MKIGIYSVPDVDPERAVGFAETVYEFPNHKISRTGFSEKNKISIKGGWFGQIVLSMRSYGLIEENNDELQTTELTARLLYPKPGTTELQDAKMKVFKSVTLWEKLRSDGIKKTDTEKEDFWVYLSELEGIKGLDREKVKKRASIVQKHYISALSYIQDAREPISPISSKMESPKIKPKTIGFDRRGTTTQVEVGKEPIKIQKGSLYIEIIQDEKALENIDYAKDLLDFMGNRLRKKAGAK